MLRSSAGYQDLVSIYVDSRTALPRDLCLVCLEFAGLVGRGTGRYMFFWVY